VDQRLAAATDGCTGNALFAWIYKVAAYWAAIVDARTSTRLKRDSHWTLRNQYLENFPNGI
jgi:hypothetical protein